MSDQEPVVETEATRELVKPDEHVPEVLLALPLNQRPIFPTMLLPLVIPPGRLAAIVRAANEKMHGYVGFFLTRKPVEDLEHYTLDDLEKVGSAARIVKSAEHESGGMHILVQVLARWVIDGQEVGKPNLVVRGQAVRTVVDADDPQVRAYAMAIVSALKELVEHNPVFVDEIKMVLSNFNNIDGPGRLADLAASLTTAKREAIQEILATFPIQPRMEKVLALLAQERELSQLKGRIQQQINERISEHQRKFFLHEQLKAIKQELGIETDEKSLELQRLQESYDQHKDAMPVEVREAVEGELRKLRLLDPTASEYGVSRHRLEWLLVLPWGVLTEDDLDLIRLRQRLDADHYGLEDIKDRIVEFCAVRRLKQDRGGGIVCLVGPPGTGKTSIGASVARALGRKFFRLSLGGMRDEAEIKGHRRTYVGALPGKMVQALRRCGSMNPVILLDEIDKLSHGLQGDPASALLEVLDPEQNRDFLDHYLDVRVDLSQVLFICTANDLGTIPEPLKDRMEIIRLAGYIETEKVEIARSFLVPKQLQAHGLPAGRLRFAPPALLAIIRGHAREAGVRQLEQAIAKVCRKVAAEQAAHDSRRDRGEASGTLRPQRVGAKDLERFLGKPQMRDEDLLTTAMPGVVTGLAWTALGGATLEIETVAIPAKEGGFQLTGQLGEVMKESASLARSYLRAREQRFGVAPGWFDRHLIHVHVPAGATPKDGPSAGVTMATAMLSLALGRPVRRGLGMTGELTLTGRVFPIGGVREKTVAARRARLTRILLPQGNERDWAELPEHLKQDLEVVFCDTLDEVLLQAGLVSPSECRKPPR